jgi:chromosome segregation ATPase
VNKSLQLAVERTRFAEERAAFVDELTAARGHRAEIRQLERQLALAQAQVDSHAEAVKDMEDRLAKSAEEKKAWRARLAGQGQGLAQEGDSFWNQSGYEKKVLLEIS